MQFATRAQTCCISGPCARTHQPALQQTMLECSLPPERRHAAKADSVRVHNGPRHSKPCSNADCHLSATCRISGFRVHTQRPTPQQAMLECRLPPERDMPHKWIPRAYTTARAATNHLIKRRMCTAPMQPTTPSRRHCGRFNSSQCRPCAQPPPSPRSVRRGARCPLQADTSRRSASPRRRRRNRGTARRVLRRW